MFIDALPHLLVFSSTQSACFSAATLLEHLLATTKSIWPMLSKHADLPKLCHQSIKQLCFEGASDDFSALSLKNLVNLSVQIQKEAFSDVCKKLATLAKKEVKTENSSVMVRNLSCF